MLFQLERSLMFEPKRHHLEMFYLNIILNFEIPPVHIGIPVIDRLITGLTAQQSGTTA